MLSVATALSLSFAGNRSFASRPRPICLAPESLHIGPPFITDVLASFHATCPSCRCQRCLRPGSRLPKPEKRRAPAGTPCYYRAHMRSQTRKASVYPTSGASKKGRFKEIRPPCGKPRETQHAPFLPSRRIPVFVFAACLCIQGGFTRRH